MMKNRIVLFTTLIVIFSAMLYACTKGETQEKRVLDDNTISKNTISNRPTLDELLILAGDEDVDLVLPKLARKDYSAICEKALKGNLDFQKSSNMPIYFSWHLIIHPDPTLPPCESNIPGICIAIVFYSPEVATSKAYEFDGKLIIVPDDEDNGFTEDGYLVVGCPIEIEGSPYVIKEGIYKATFDENAGRYIAVAVDFEIN